MLELRRPPRRDGDVSEDENHRFIRRFKLKNDDLVTVESLDLFDKQLAKLGLADSVRNIIELTILAGDARAVVVQGTNGIRKIRFAPPGENIGKSGGYRVFYLFEKEYKFLFLMAILSKSEEANLSKAQRNLLAGLVVRLKAYAKERNPGR